MHGDVGFSYEVLDMSFGMRETVITRSSGGWEEETLSSAFFFPINPHLAPYPHIFQPFFPVGWKDSFQPPPPNKRAKHSFGNNVAY